MYNVVLYMEYIDASLACDSCGMVKTIYNLRLFNFVLSLLLETGEKRQEMDKITGSSKVYDFICCGPKIIKRFTRLSNQQN